MIPSSAINKNRKKTNEEFSNDVKKLYGDKYNCDRVEYINNKTKVILICDKHGEFSARPNDILGGHCCRKCGEDRCKAMSKKLTKTQEDFIKQAKEIHGDRYNYNKVIYKNSITDIIIICSEHGEFKQLPACHINSKNGCNKCSATNRGFLSRKTQDEFIEQSKSIHGDKFDYSKTVYNLSNSKVIITCKKHGDFEQTPNNHLIFDCPKCGTENSHNITRKTTENFIIESKTVHGDLYDYTNTVYTSAFDNVDITCKIHGVFSQIARSHTQGYGCQKCSALKNEKESIEIIERITNMKFIKKRHEFLKSEKGANLELDGYNEELKLAIEYNGKQHYEIVEHFHRNGMVDLLRQIKNDTIKQVECTKNNIYLISIPYYVTDKETFIKNEYENYEFLRSYFI